MKPDELAAQIYNRPYGSPEIVALRMPSEVYYALLRDCWQAAPGVVDVAKRTFMGREIIEDDGLTGVELLDQQAVDEIRKSKPAPALRDVDVVSDYYEYDLGDGKRIRLAGSEVRRFGAVTMLHRMGLGPNPADLPRKPVYQGGEMIGTLPADFNPYHVRSTSMLYEARAGDFKETSTAIEAAKSLCPGDLLAVVGFRPA